MIKVFLVVLESDNEEEIDGAINAMDGVLDYRCSFSDQPLNAEVTEGVYNANKALRRLSKEEK